ncbi:glycosyltransferase family 71 protein, partial [Nemania sp. FL0916]
MTSTAFSRPALGPKEGRLPPGLLSPVSVSRRRRFTSRQKNAFLFATVLLAFVVYSTYFQPGVLARLEELQDVQHHLPVVGPNFRRGGQTSQSQKPLVGEAGKSEEKSKGPVSEGNAKQNAHHGKPKSETEGKEQVGKQWLERPNLKEDLDATFALLPDEMGMREFLRPIRYGGPKRMKELGLRTRAYQRFLSAWEKIHLVEDKRTGEVHVRDNVIQYLRGIQDDTTNNFDSALTNTIHNYETFRSFMVKFAKVLFPFTSPYFADHMTLHSQFKNAGRGIVLTAGDEQAHYLLTTIYALRKIGCELPIEIMYLGDSDLGEDHRFELEALPGVTTRDLSEMVDDDGWKLAGWAIKPFAMLLSSFREVIFIDADSFFFRDPAKLFDDPDYKNTGALFFRDRTIMPESKRRWLLQILPRPIHQLARESSWWTGTSGHHQESGVVVVDKWKHFVSMLLICRFNGSDRDPKDGMVGVYEMMHGDKETFWIGFLLAGDPMFAFHKGTVGSIGVVEDSNATAVADAESESTDVDKAPSPDQAKELDDRSLSETSTEAPSTYTICSPQLLHLDVDGTPLWFNGWLLVNKYIERAHRRFSPMKSYMREPSDTAVDADFWQLATDNMCCLTSDAELKHDLSEHDLEFLKMLRDRALEVGIM